MKVKSILGLSLLAVVLGLSACDQKSQTAGSASTGQQTLAAVAEESTQPTTVVITHAKGQTEVPAHPKRVIVFDTALLDSLGFIGVREEIIGVPQPKMPFPAVLAQYQDKKYLNAGTLQEPDFEAISGVDPDLIIASGRADRAYDELSKIAPTVTLSVDWANYYDSMRDVTLTAARLFDKEEEANTAFDDLDELVQETKAKASEAGTAVFIMVNGGKMSAYGAGSRFGFIFDVLGMKPATNLVVQGQGTHGNVISMEYLLETNPDWIFVLDRESAIGESSDNAAARQVMDNEIVRQTKAYQNGHIIYVDSQALYLAGGLGTYHEFVKSVDEAISR